MNTTSSPLFAFPTAARLMGLIAACSLAGSMQIANAQSYSTSTGIPSFAAPEPVELGFADTANGSLHITIPLGAYSQRSSGQPEAVNLIYDSNIWKVVTSAGSNVWDASTGLGGEPITNGGWVLSQQIVSRGLPAGGASGCTDDVAWQDRSGTAHYFPLPMNPYDSTCPQSGSAYASDSSGFWMTESSSGVLVYAPDGTLVYSYPGVQDAKGNYIVSKDTNGNYLSTNNANFYDTLGRTLLQYGGSSSNPTYIVPTSQGTSPYQLSLISIGLKTNFQQSGVAECNVSCGAYVIRSITLPDQAQSTYYFTYDCDSSTGNAACGSPAGQTYYYGELISVTLPTGGTINYQYTMFKDAYNNNIRWLSSKSSSGSWSYTPQVVGSTCSSTQVGCKQQTTVRKPSGDTTVYTFTLDNGAWPTQIQQYDSQSNLMSTTTNTWDFSNACALIGCHGHSYIRLLSQTVTVPAPGGTSLTKKTAYSYDSPQKGNVTAVQEWKFLPGTSPSFPSVPDRARYTTYLTTGTNNINRPLSVTACNNSGSDSPCIGGGTRVSQTVYTYDSYSSCGLTSVTNVANHDDQNFGSGYTQRGNPTQIQQWVSGSTYLNTNLCYDTTGQVLQKTDPLGNPTTYTYTDNFFNETGASSVTGYTPSAPTNAYPKTITAGGLTTTFGYYFGSGKTAIATDPNSQTTSYFFWDPFDRSTQTNYPIGWALTNYTSMTQADTYVPVGDSSPSSSCSSCQHKQFNFDSWGHKINEKLVNAPGGAVNVDTTYDGNGRVESVSHAYINTSDPSHVFETFAYDGADRKIAVTHPDGQFVLTQYGASLPSYGGLSTQQGSASTYGYGYPVLAVDEAGKQKQEWLDGFGRVIEVDEPGTVSATTGSGSATVSGSEQSIPGAPLTAGSGSVTFSGTLQSKQVQNQSATSGAGSVTVSGTLQSKQVQTQAAKPGTGSVTIYGSERDNTFDPCQPHSSCPQQIPDNGYVKITVNGFTASYTYGYPDTPSTVAAGLASALTGGSSPVTASASNGVVYLTSIATGASTNYSLSSTCNTTSSFYSGCSFSGSASGSTLTGGANAVYTTVYDSGTTTITVNGHADTASWSGSGTTSSSIASSLASNINADSGASVTASASGSTVNLTAKTMGASTNYSLSSSGTFDSTDFSSSSFSTSNSGSALTGGRDATYNTIYDSGNSTITVNGHADSFSWSGSGTTSSSIASGLASSINADSSAFVTASASGSTVNLTAKTTGASTNYSLSSSSTYDSTDFSSASFSSSNSGSTLTGGTNGPITYDSGTAWVTVNGFQALANYGQNSTSSAVASAIASVFNSSTSSPVTANASGSTISLTAKASGTETDYSLSSGSSTGQPGTFSSASFTVGVSGSAFTGGTNPTSATYATGSVGIGGSEQTFNINFCPPPATPCPTNVPDSGTVTITVGGFAAQTTYSNGSTGQTIASALANLLNSSSSPVTASASGGTVFITSKGDGSGTDLSLSATSATQYASYGESPSFWGSMSGSSLSGGSGGVSSSAVATFYIYDAADHLTQVVQGAQTRTFTYDGLGRMTSRTTPEAGMDFVYFTQSDNVSLCAGSAKAVCRRTDARGITTTYAYNSRSQLTGKSYSNGQGSVTNQYDQGSFALGRLTSITDPSGSETLTYDQGGRITQIQKVIGTTTFPIGYQYNTGGQVTQINYPSGRQVQQNVDSIGLLNTIVSGTTTYASIPEPPTGYNAAGQLLTFTYANGVVANFGYSSSTRDQMTSLSYAKGSTTLFSLNYGYMNGQANCGNNTTAGNDGQIQCIQDTVDNGRSVLYEYDGLNRLASALTVGDTGPNGYAQWGLAWAYDQYGNRLSQSVTGGTAPSNSLSFATTPAPPTNPPGGAYTNRPDGYSFDASGNMLNDGLNNLAYDTENCLTSAATTTYTCDAHSIRVKKALQGSTITVYVFAGGKDIAEYDYTSGSPSPGSPSREYIYLNGKILATIQGSSTVYHHADHLSVRVITDSNGNKIGEQGHYPFGEQWYAANTTTKFFFTSYERDAESGNDYAMARFYINRLGRFSCVDPVLGQPGDPQSWNRYVYVRNNPTNDVDPSGQSLFSWIWRFFMALISYSVGVPIYIPGAPGAGPIGTPPTFPDPTGLPSVSPQELALVTKYGTPPFLEPGTAYYDPNASGGGGSVNKKILADCVDQYFGVRLDRFDVTQNGKDGLFVGYGPNTLDNGGNNANIYIKNYVGFSSAQLTELNNSFPDHNLIGKSEHLNGLELPANPYTNYTAYDDTSALVQTQVHELGNSLHDITQAAFNPETVHWNPVSDYDEGQLLQDCVRSRGGFK